MKRMMMALAVAACAVQAHALPSSWYSFTEFGLVKDGDATWVTTPTADAAKLFELPAATTKSDGFFETGYYSVYTFTDAKLGDMKIDGEKFGKTTYTASDIAAWFASNMADAQATVDANKTLGNATVSRVTTSILDGKSPAQTRNPEGENLLVQYRLENDLSGFQTKEGGDVHVQNPWTVLFYNADGKDAADLVVVLHASESTTVADKSKAGTYRGTTTAYDDVSGWTSVPEPTSGLLLLLGVAGLALRRGRK